MYRRRRPFRKWLRTGVRACLQRRTAVSCSSSVLKNLHPSPAACATGGCLYTIRIATDSHSLSCTKACLIWPAVSAFADHARPLATLLDDATIALVCSRRRQSRLRHQLPPMFRAVSGPASPRLHFRLSEHLSLLRLRRRLQGRPCRAGMPRSRRCRPWRPAILAAGGATTHARPCLHLRFGKRGRSTQVRVSPGRQAHPLVAARYESAEAEAWPRCRAI